MGKKKMERALKRTLICLACAAGLMLGSLLAVGAVANQAAPWWLPYPLMTAAVCVAWCGGLMSD